MRRTNTFVAALTAFAGLVTAPRVANATDCTGAGPCISGHDTTNNGLFVESRGSAQAARRRGMGGVTPRARKR